MFAGLDLLAMYFVYFSQRSALRTFRISKTKEVPSKYDGSVIALVFVIPSMLMTDDS